MQWLVTTGPIVFLVGLGGAFVMAMLAADQSGEGMLRTLMQTLAFGIAGFLGGAWLGIAHFCSPENTGSLCGLGGVFGTGPLLSGLFMLGWAGYELLTVNRN